MFCGGHMSRVHTGLLSIALLSGVLAGCARTSVMPLSADTVQITVSAAPVCGAAGAQSVAVKQAAVETIRQGFDRFIIIGGQAQNNVGMAYLPPTQSTTYGSGTITTNPYSNSAFVSGSSTTTYSGGGPMYYGSHDQSLIVKMFKDTDPNAQNAISARTTLGEKWQEAVASKTNTCS